MSSERSTWSARLDNSVKAEITEMVNQSGDTPNDFVKKLVSSYKLQQAVQAVPLAGQDIADLRTHMGAIESVFSGLLLRMQTEIFSKQQEAEEIVAEVTADAKAAQARHDDQIRLFRADMEKLTAKCDELEKRVRAADRERGELLEREAAGADKLKVMTELVDQYRARAGEIEDIDALKRDLVEAKAAVVRMRNDAEAAEARYKASLDEMGLKYRQDVLELKERQQDELEAIRARHAVKPKKDRSAPGQTAAEG